MPRPVRLIVGGASHHGVVAVDQVKAWATELAATASASGAVPATVLAAVAASLGIPWDPPRSPGPREASGAVPSHGRGQEPGPASLVVPRSPARVPGWVALDAAREVLLDVGTRRRLGAHHTPPALARRLVALAFAFPPDTPSFRRRIWTVDRPDSPPERWVVCDPACGGGAFLVAAAEALVGAGADPATVVAEQLVGFEVDPLAVATTRAALRCWARDHGVAGVEPRRIVVGDGLAAEWDADVDVVVGNPPFLSPLGSDTGGGPAAVELRRRLGAPYADVATLFLVAALERVRPGGRVVLIQPESLLSARDARPIRAAVAPHLAGVWIAGEPVFAASVRVVAPVLERRPDDDPAAGRSDAAAAERARRIARWRGAAVRSAGSATFDRSAATWSHLRPTTTPTTRAGHGPTVGDLATATAGFRDEFYALAAAVTDAPAAAAPSEAPDAARAARAAARAAGVDGSEPEPLVDRADEGADRRSGGTRRRAGDGRASGATSRPGLPAGSRAALESGPVDAGLPAGSRAALESGTVDAGLPAGSRAALESGTVDAGLPAGPKGDAGGAFPLVTSGLIDPGRCAWGERPARIGGRRYLAPVVRPADLEGRIRTWTEARLVPKVLVATQTRVVEAAPDPEGRLVPLTPVLAVVPHDPADVWRLAAALTAPAVTAWARHEFAGAALSSDAVKLSAKQVLLAPLPTDVAAWATATDRLRAGDVRGCGEALADTDRRLLDWWRNRLP